MSIFLITVISIALFFLSYSWFISCAQVAQNDTPSPVIKILCQPITPFLTLGFIGCLLGYFVTPDQYDALFPQSLWPLITSFACATGFVLLSHRFPKNSIQFCSLLILCSLNTFLLPADFTLCNGAIPVIIERILLALLWCLFAFLYNNLNNVDGILTIQSLSFSLGIMLMFVIGILPALEGFYGCIFIALFLGFHFFSRYPEILSLNAASCRTLGFVLGWLGILATLEGNSSCVIILSMYYLYELITALFKKIISQKPRNTLVEYTFYSNLAAHGISPKNICELVARINLIMILLAGFQIYSPNYYTVILVAFFMVFWIIARILSPEEKSNNHLLLSGRLFSLFRNNKKENKQNKDD